MMTTDLTQFERWPFENAGVSHDVFSLGLETNPIVIVMHELPGMAPDCVDFTLRLRDQGFRVHLPLLFGDPLDNSALRHSRALCVSEEFARLKAGTTAPITDWLRALARHLSSASGGRRLGAIGMCLTGAFVIPMIIEPGVHAGVISQPAIPYSLAYRFTGVGRGAWMRELNVSDQDLENATRCAREGGKSVLLQRMTGDRLSPPERQQRLAEAFGSRTEDVVSYDDRSVFRRIFNPPHALLTTEFANHRNDPDHVTKAAFAKMVAFLHKHLH